MIKLTSMKLSGESPESTAPKPDRPAYPWGLELRLDEEALSKLKVTDLPDIDSKVGVVAKAMVVGVSSNKMAGDEKAHRSLTLQITELAITDGSSAASRKLYGKE